MMGTAYFPIGISFSSRNSVSFRTHRVCVPWCAPFIHPSHPFLNPAVEQYIANGKSLYLHLSCRLTSTSIPENTESSFFPGSYNNLRSQTLKQPLHGTELVPTTNPNNKAATKKVVHLSRRMETESWLISVLLAQLPWIP